MDELRTLETLLQELLNGLQEVLQSGETLTDEFQLMLAEELNWLTDRIDELKIQTPSQPLDLKEAMPSSNIGAYQYDEDNQKLFVQFLGKYPNRQGPVYSYDNVPKVIFDLFKKGSVPARTDGKNQWGKWWKGKVPSIGASMYTLLKNGPYPYQRVN